MNALDIILLIPLIYGLYKGYKSGFIIQITTLAAIFAGIYVAMRFTSYTEKLLSENWEVKQSELPLIAFILTFIAVGVGVYFLGKAIQLGMKTTVASPIDKMAGLCLGGCKVILIIGVVLILFTRINKDIQVVNTEIFNESYLYSPMVNTTKTLLPIIDESKTFVQESLFKKDSTNINEQTAGN